MSRKVFCKHYPDCLKKCVNNGGHDFDCAGCKSFEKTGATFRDLVGGCMLLASLFLPKVYAEYVKGKDGRKG